MSPTLGISPFGRKTRFRVRHCEMIGVRVLMYSTRNSSSESRQLTRSPVGLLAERLGAKLIERRDACIEHGGHSCGEWSSGRNQPGLAPAIEGKSREPRCAAAESGAVDWPSAFVLARLTKNSRVAFRGATPMPSTTATSLPFNLIRIGTSPPKEKMRELDHRGRENGRHASVDGIATLTQNS